MPRALLVTAPLLPLTARPSASLTLHPDPHPHPPPDPHPHPPPDAHPHPRHPDAHPNPNQADEALLKQHYGDLVEKPFFPSLLEYMMSGPVTCMVWEGTNAVKVGRMMLGETNPQARKP